MIQTTHNTQNTHSAGGGSLTPRERRAKQADASAQIRGFARARPWPVVGNRAGAIRMAGSEHMRAGRPWQTTGQGPRTHVSESPGKPKLGRANNLQNSTQHTAPVRAGTPLGTPMRTGAIAHEEFSFLAMTIALPTSQEESVRDVFWCARLRALYFVSVSIL